VQPVVVTPDERERPKLVQRLRQPARRHARQPPRERVYWHGAFVEQHPGLENAQRERVQRVDGSLHGTAHPNAAREGCDVGRRGQGDVRPPAEQLDQLLVASTPQPLGE
jgi:hypothetical protein